MSIKQQYTNFAQLISKNAVVATLIIILAVTTVGASAAELFAPEEFKPSRLLGLQSSQEEEDGEEEEAEVTNYEECIQQEDAQILEKFPEECIFEGESFTRELTQDEIAALNEEGENNEQQGKDEKEEEIEEAQEPAQNKVLTSQYMPDVSLKYSNNWKVIEPNINGRENFIESNERYDVTYTLKNNGAELFISATKGTARGGIGQYIKDYKRISPYLAREKFQELEGDKLSWFYIASYDGRELSTSGTPISGDGCMPGESNQEERKPGDQYCGGAIFTKESNNIIYSISYSGPDSLLQEVDQMVLNSGIQFGN